METTLKEFLKTGLNKLDRKDSEYKNGERYQANCNSPFDTTYFRTKKEAKEMWQSRFSKKS